ncbi:MAG TPA: EscR/YscR/HrcR family type III secretion system export apparatus protein [Oligoflexia bacterium]|nr:EscR/YscR/HrcR family type III secretion system export apparatus protein [Oligoflexia bacterium]HMP49691.1 EscR/YscR/HrcR family type III secretion system export apparatus protein [Oligoflexia bacterium]
MSSSSITDGLSFVSQSGSVTHILSLLALGALPIVFMCATSYLKVSVVLAILRNALGGGQLPSQALSGMLALIISLFTMFPVLELCLDSYTRYEENNPIIEAKGSKETRKKSGVLNIINKSKAGLAPLSEFLRLNTSPRERMFFFSLDQKRLIVTSRNNSPLNEDELSSEKPEMPCIKLAGTALETCLREHERVSGLLLSFMMSELRSACTIGIYLFLPFLVIDLIVSTILTGLGMMMVSPITISLPLKLLIFVLSDGWRVLTEKLILAYQIPGLGV